ncbi:MAG: type II secretion system protein GspG [Nitrospirota bacterium]
MLRKQRGFTLVEVIVVAGIIAILAGILVPLILKEIDEARITRSYADVRSMSTSIVVFRKDTGKWPNLNGGCTATVSFVFGEGALPSGLAAQGYDQTTSVSLDDYLAIDGTGCYGARWKGPYLAHTSADPWGNAYFINAGNFAGGAVWILSAGPNGTIETPAGAPVLQGDDVGIMVFRSTVILE